MSDEATPQPEPTDPADVQPTAEHAAANVNGTAPEEPVVLPPPAPASLPPHPPGLAQDRPELLVGAAFAGGAVLALLLKRLAR